METDMPYSVCLAGPGLDQKYLSQFLEGWNLTLSIHPTYNFFERGGMATSTRNTAIEKWGNLPEGDRRDQVYNAMRLFNAENKGKTDYISGFQDSAGICIKGLVSCLYDNDYIPKIVNINTDDNLLQWLEDHIQLIELEPRPQGFNLFRGRMFNRENAEELAESAVEMRKAIIDRDLEKFGEELSRTREGYANVFPNSLPTYARMRIEELGDDIYGCKLNGAGGGGYLICATDKPLENGIPISIRR